jgi:hypothetical protein
MAKKKKAFKLNIKKPKKVEVHLPKVAKAITAPPKTNLPTGKMALQREIRREIWKRTKQK